MELIYFYIVYTEDCTSCHINACNAELCVVIVYSTLVVATGIWQPAEPPIEGAEYMDNYETVSTNPDDFEGQTVLILG